MTEVYVMDCETTGVNEPIGVVEVAWARLYQEEGDWTFGDRFSSLIKSPYPITCPAGGVNGLRDIDLVDAPKLEEVEFPKGPIVFVGHNVSFDRPLVEEYLGIEEELCTMILSRRLLPGVENYKLGTLVCACDLSKQIGHRAEADVTNTAELLIYLLQGTGWSMQKMIDFYKKPWVHKYMPFGKHAGELMRDVPMGYLTWLTKQDLDRDMRTTVDYELQRR